MSDSLMNTEKGGEQTQYESVQTVTNPPKKSSGQLGDAATTGDSSATSEGAAAQAERGAKTAENIRYGQGISEGGMGGQTTAGTAGTGEANDAGFGRVKSQEEGPTAGRDAQGYGAASDMDSTVGG